MDRKIYVDHAATTFVKKEVIDEMLPYFSDYYGNASSLYWLGRESKKAVENARIKVAKAIGANASEIFFTGSGTEADNWAIKGICNAKCNKGRHIITSGIEHPAVLNSCKYLEKNGFEVTYIGVDEFGILDVEQLKNSIRTDTVLISIMYANNEIGTIQPIEQIGDIAKGHGIYFHTDAVQAVANVPIDVSKLNIDLLTMSAHKFNGPKGIGALYIKKGTKIHNLIHGGSQESGRRASTENVPAIVGMGKAIELATMGLEQKSQRLIDLRDTYIKKITERIPYIKLNGHPTNRLPNNANISFEFVEGESMLLMLDRKGVYASTGSACSSGSLDPSHVLLAIGLKHEIAHGSLRVSFGEENTFEDIDYIVDSIDEVIAKLRKMSPLYEEIERGIKNV